MDVKSERADAGDGTAEPISRDQFLRPGQDYFPCSADHERDWQPYPVDAYSAMSHDHTYPTKRVLLAYEKIKTCGARV